MTGTKMNGVAYRGAPPALNDVMAGHVALMFADTGTVVAQIAAGKVRALGVTSTTRVPALPDIPTIAEAGVPGFDAVGWTMICAPAATPKPIVDRLHAELKAVAAMPDIQAMIDQARHHSGRKPAAGGAAEIPGVGNRPLGRHHRTRRRGEIAVAPTARIHTDGVRISMSDEALLREKTATLARMLDMQGTIGMFGHVSIRVPGTNRCFISPGASTEKTTVRPKDIFVFDIDGTIIEHPGGLIPLEWRIHTQIHRDRPDAMCIAHLHAPHARALGIAGKELVPVFLHGSFLRGGVPTWNNPRLVVNDEQAADLSRALGDKWRADARPWLRGRRRDRGGGVLRLHVPGGECADPVAGRNHGRRDPAHADEARDCAEGTFNPRLFPLLWTYYERKVPASFWIGMRCSRKMPSGTGESASERQSEPRPVPARWLVW